MKAAATTHTTLTSLICQIFSSQNRIVTIYLVTGLKAEKVKDLEEGQSVAVKKFFKGEAIQFGWSTMKHNLGFFIGLLIAAGLFIYTPEIIGWLIEERAPVVSIIFSVASSVLELIIGMGLIRIALKFTDKIEASFGDLFSCLPLFFKYLFSSILYGLIVFAGIILLIIPGIIWGIKFQFYSYFIVDKGLGPIESLKRSSLITKGVKWNLFLFGLLLAGINLLGVLALFIGLFATIPTSMVATAFVYRKLLIQTESVQISVTSQEE